METHQGLYNDTNATPTQPPLAQTQNLSDILFEAAQRFIIEESINLSIYPVFRGHFIHQVHPLLSSNKQSYGVMKRLYNNPKHLWDGALVSTLKSGIENASIAAVNYAQVNLGLDIEAVVYPLPQNVHPVLHIGYSMISGTLLTASLLAPGYALQPVSACKALDGETEEPRNLSIFQWLYRILYKEHKPPKSSETAITKRANSRELNWKSIQCLISGLLLRSFHFTLDRFLSSISSNILIYFVNQKELSTSSIEFAVILSRVVTSGLTFPLTAIHSRLMAQYIFDQDDEEHRYSGVIDCAKKTYQKEGFHAFYRGWAGPLGFDILTRFLF